MLSRILGLVRDILFFATFGTSLFGEAFLLAFTLPNLFRRMLGEGTLSSAFIPVFANLQNSNHCNTQWKLLNQVLTRLLSFLVILSLLVGLVCWITYEFNILQNPKWHEAIFLNGITFIYVIFICASAILVGALNVKNSFWAGAFSPVVLNAFMICALFFSGVVYSLNFSKCALALSISVVFAGIFQLFLPWFELRKKFNWKWNLNFSQSSQLNEVKTLFWVGAFGAAIAQINILVSRLLAYLLEEQGPVSYLYMSARLVELPLGVFAIALSTILFPQLSRAISLGDEKKYNETFLKGLRIIIMFTVPSAVGLYVLGDLIIRTLFEWREFRFKDAALSSEVLSLVAWTIPLYALSTFLIKSFHSQKNMRVPLRAAVLSLLVNLMGSFFLMGSFGVMGLAWANLLAAFFQLAYLALRNSNISLSSAFFVKEICFPNVLLASFVMFLALNYCRNITQFGQSKTDIILQLIVTIGLGMFTYFSVLLITKFPFSQEKPLLFRANRK